MVIEARLSVPRHNPATHSFEPVDITFAGESEDFFREAATRAAREQADWGEQVIFLDLIDPEFANIPEKFTVQLDELATFGQIADVFGDDLATSPAHVHGGWGGRGGGDGAFQTVAEFLPVVAQVGGYVSATVLAWKTAVRLRYGPYRALAKDWNDTRVISDALAAAISNQPIWTRRSFDECFGLSADRGPELLISLGYERVGIGLVEEWINYQWGVENRAYRQ